MVEFLRERKKRKLRNFKNTSDDIFFSIATKPISTKLDTKHLGWREFTFVQMKVRLIPWGDRSEVAKIHWRNFIIFFRGTGPISTKLLDKGNSFVQRNVHATSQWEMVTKLIWRDLNLFPKTAGPISTKLGTKHACVN